MLNGIPVRKLPTELLSQPDRDDLQTVPLSLLRQKQPEDYILAAGDVLGVFIAGVFPPTTADQPLASPPVYFPSQIDPLGAGLPPSLGYPVTIRNDGTLALPLVDPISLDGLTVEQANERVRDAYADQGNPAARSRVGHVDADAASSNSHHGISPRGWWIRSRWPR